MNQVSSPDGNLSTSKLNGAHTISLHVLGIGNGTSAVIHGLCSSGFVLNIDEVPFMLIDFGLGCGRAFREIFGPALPLPNYVYISHNHADHAAELPPLVAWKSKDAAEQTEEMKATTPKVPITIVAHQKVKDRLETFRFEDIRAANSKYNWILCEEGKPTQITEEISMEVFHSQHTEICYGFVLRFRNVPILAFTGDSGMSPSTDTNPNLHSKLAAQLDRGMMLIDARSQSSYEHASYEQVSNWIRTTQANKPKLKFLIYHHATLNMEYEGLSFVEPRHVLKLWPQDS